jgi:hypothetical protein
MAWFVWLVRSLPSQTYHQYAFISSVCRVVSCRVPWWLNLACAVHRARTWPDYDESADIYLVNDNELYVYPEHSEFFAVFTSELYRVEDSSRYYFIISGTHHARTRRECQGSYHVCVCVCRCFVGLQTRGTSWGSFSARGRRARHSPGRSSRAWATTYPSGTALQPSPASTNLIVTYAVSLLFSIRGVWDNAGGKVGGGTDPKWKSQKKDKSKSVVVRGSSLLPSACVVRVVCRVSCARVRRC